ncbi:fibronectin type III domain-containing protein [bacterium]|nr:fibronectin type III domain-containing protein [bacterium]
MQKVSTKNKTLFYLIVFVAGLFLMLTTVQKAGAQAPETDVTPPDDVTNLQIELYDGAAKLSWDVATDDTGVVGYKIYSGPDAVTPEGGEYSYDTIDAGDTIEYLVTELENGKEIHFTVTAYDAAGNESENYSNEVYGTPDSSYGEAPTPEHPAADEEPPAVSDAQALDSATVKVVFSEPVVLPADSAETAFSIINNATDENLAVTAVELDPDDVLGETVLLTTDPQEGGAEYILTAGIQIEDTVGNPIVSGTSDTAAFIGSTVEPGTDLTGDLPANDFDAPTVVSAEAEDKNTLQVVFSEPVILDSDPESNFLISKVDDPAVELSISSVVRDETGSIVTITTVDQLDIEYSVVVTGVLDEAGNKIDDLANSATFMGSTTEAQDTSPEDITPPSLALTPENVKNFVASIVSDFVVRLTWQKPDDVSIIDQVLYKSTDGGTNYDAGTSLGANKEQVDVNGLVPGNDYYFKLTTKDVDGNESDGVITHIKLPSTGMGVGLLIGASMGLAALKNKKKK